MTPKHTLFMALLCLCHNIIFSILPKLRFRLFLPIFITLIAFQTNVLQAQTQKKVKVISDVGVPIPNVTFFMNGQNYTTDENGAVLIEESQISQQITKISNGHLIREIYKTNEGINIKVKADNSNYSALMRDNEDLRRLVQRLETELRQKETHLENLRRQEEELRNEIATLNERIESLESSEDLINRLNRDVSTETRKARGLLQRLDSIKNVAENAQTQIEEHKIKLVSIEQAKNAEKAEREKVEAEKETEVAKARLWLTFTITIGLLLISILLIILFFATKKNYKTVKELNEELKLRIEELQNKEEVERKLNNELKIKIEELEKKKELEKAYKTIIKQHMELREKKEELEASETNLKATANALEAKTKDLEKTANDLKRVQREKEKFTRMVVHDFKNPLTTLLNPQSNSEYIRLAAQHIKMYVQDLQDIQNFEKGEFQIAINEHDLQQVVEDVTALLSSESLVRGLNLYSTVPSKTMARFDKNVLSRILMNLVSNALKYTNKGEVKIYVEEVNDKVRVNVKDTGKGIPEDKLADILKLGVSIQSRKFAGIGATGIGLTFCDMALSKHHSTIRVESELGKGTCFYFDLEKGNNYQNSEEEVIFKGYDEKEIQQLKDSMHHLLKDDKIKSEIMPQINRIKNIKWYKTSEIKRALEAIESNHYIVNSWKERLLEYRAKSYKTNFEELINLNLN